MTHIFEDLVLPKFEYNIKTLYWEFMKLPYREGFMTYLKCINRLGYYQSPDVVKLIAWNISEVYTRCEENKFLLHASTLHELSYKSYLVYSQHWINTPLLQKN